MNTRNLLIGFFLLVAVLTARKFADWSHPDS